MIEHATPEDIVAIEQQLGRVPRGVIGIAARMADGSPAVVATAPRLPDGSPFPTLYYMTHPELTASMSRLEAEGSMKGYERRLTEDETFAERYRAAHERYVEDRRLYGDVPEIDGVSAGGMPVRVKCLHALAAHSLAAGPGVNPVGDLALCEDGWDWTSGRVVYHRLR